MPSISVIIPTHNRKELIGQTIESILRQTHKASEIIVVDDHSTDGTVDFLKSKYGTEVLVLKNSGKGPGAARNKGVQVATGDYIKFFDSDDLMTRNSLEAQLKTLTQTRKEFVYTPYFRARQQNDGSWLPIDNLVMHYYPYSKTRALSGYMITDGLFIAIPGMLLSKQLLNEAGPWREDATAYEDFDYLFRLSLIEPNPSHTNACAFVYRIHGAQSTEGNFSDEQRDHDKIKVLNDLQAKAKGLGKINTALFANKFYQLYRESKSPRIKTDLKQYNSLLNRVIWETLRIKSRAGRFATKTAWQPSHGPLQSPEKIREYLSELN